MNHLPQIIEPRSVATDRGSYPMRSLLRTRPWLTLVAALRVLFELLEDYSPV